MFGQMYCAVNFAEQREQSWERACSMVAKCCDMHNAELVAQHGAETRNHDCSSSDGREMTPLHLPAHEAVGVMLVIAWCRQERVLNATHKSGNSHTTPSSRHTQHQPGTTHSSHRSTAATAATLTRSNIDAQWMTYTQ